MKLKFFLTGLLLCLALGLAACTPPAMPAAARVAETTPGLTPQAVVEEMVSMIVDAPGANHVDVFGEMVSMIVDAPGSLISAHIANAMSAAPMAIAKDATILDFPANAGEPMVVLREGTNNWTCYADWPASPGNDPECNDPVAEGWLSALFSGQEAPPAISTPGIAYMLMGGSDPSNTDPMAAGPAPGEDWISTPGHVMLLAPGGFDAAYFAAEPKQDEPFIMWDGTPYEHLMIPVVPMAADQMGDTSEAMQSAMSAAPLAISKDATLLEFPATAGDPMVVLREGTNGWTCYADWPASPGNDPECNDPIAEGWLTALFSGQEAPPAISTPGIAYMLVGGSDPSNTDPLAPEPAAGEDWVTSPAHLMLFVPGGFDAELFTTDHTSGFPYIMWDGSPYEHLMLPVADMNM